MLTPHSTFSKIWEEFFFTTKQWLLLLLTLEIICLRTKGYKYTSYFWTLNNLVKDKGYNHVYDLFLDIFTLLKENSNSKVSEQEQGGPGHLMSNHKAVTQKHSLFLILQITTKVGNLEI